MSCRPLESMGGFVKILTKPKENENNSILYLNILKGLKELEWRNIITNFYFL